MREQAEALLALETARQGYPDLVIIRPDLAAAMRSLGMWDDKRHMKMPKMPRIRKSDIYTMRNV